MNGYYCPKCGCYTRKRGEKIDIIHSSWYCQKCNIDFVTFMQYRKNSTSFEHKQQTLKHEIIKNILGDRG